MATNIEDLRTDKRAHLAFCKTFKRLASLQLPVEMEWKELHEARSKIADEMELVLQRHISDNEGMNEETELGYETGKEYLSWIAEEFERREKEGDKGPFKTRKMYFPVKTESKVIPINSKTYRGMFYGDEQASLDRGDFKSFDDFLMTLSSGRSDPRLEKRTHAEVTGAEGGFAVPEEFGGWLMDKSLENEIVRSRATVYPMQSASRVIPAWDNDTHTNNVYGGFSGEWLAEAGTGTIQTGALRQMTLKAKKLAIYTEASREVLADGLDFANQLGNALVKSIGFYLDYAFLSENGVNKPLGVLNSPSIITVTRAGANAVAWADVYTMYSRLHPACQSNAVWIANHEVLPQLMNMTVNNYLVFVPGMFMGVAGPVPATLFGKPIIFTEKTPALGTEGDLMLCDLSQYVIGLRQEIIVDRSNAPGWTRDVESFRVIIRADGQSLWDKPITPKKGTHTLSWCVVLQ